MSGNSPDPKMMRSQQDKDVPETIEADETRPSHDRHDSDAASAADRRAAGDHPIADPARGQDDVLAANRAAIGVDKAEAPSPHEKGPLAVKDRSLL